MNVLAVDFGGSHTKAAQRAAPEPEEVVLAGGNVKQLTMLLSKAARATMPKHLSGEDSSTANLIPRYRESKNPQLQTIS